MKTLIILLIGASAWSSHATQTIGERLTDSYLNLATLLAEARNVTGSACEQDAYQSEIVKYVRKARYSAASSNGVLAVPAEVRKAVGDSLTFKHVIGEFTGRNLLELNDAFVGIRMYGPHRGVYGNESVLSFQTNGVVEIDRLVVLASDPWVAWVTSKGHYTISLNGPRKRQIHLSLDINGKTETYLLDYKHEHFSEEWTLTPLKKPAVSPWLEGFVDYPSECEA